MSDSSDDYQNIAWQSMAQLAEHLPEVPVNMLTAVGMLCIEPNAEKRIDLGFQFVDALNRMRIVSLLAGSVLADDSEFANLPEFDFSPDAERPRYSRYGFRIDRPPQAGDNETGTPVLASDLWIGTYQLSFDDEGVQAARFLAFFDEVPDDPNHPDVVELWATAEDAYKFAHNILSVLNDTKGFPHDR